MKNTLIEFSILVIVILCISCSKRNGFFDEMPTNYDGSRLLYYGDIIDGLKVTKILDGNGIEVTCSGCKDIIPFCGSLEYRHDSIFFFNSSERKSQLFFVLGEQKFS